MASLTQTNNDVWKEVDLFLMMYGGGNFCCCPSPSYEMKIFHYNDNDLDTFVRRLIEFSYNACVCKGIRPDMFEATLVCTSENFYPYLDSGQVLCVFLRNEKRVIVSDKISDFVGNFEGPCLYLYLWKS